MITPDRQVECVCVCVCVAIMAAGDKDKSVAAASSSGSGSGTVRAQCGVLMKLSVAVMSTLNMMAARHRYSPQAVPLLSLMTFYIGHRVHFCSLAHGEGPRSGESIIRGR